MLPPRRAPVVLGLLACAAIVPAETAICWFFLDHRPADVVMTYLLGVVLVAMRFGYVASLLTATLSVFAFDFFFTAPYFSFAVEDKRYLVTFLIMLFVAFSMSNLTERVRREAAEARKRELQTAKLYALTRELSMAPSRHEIVQAAQRHLQEVFGGEVFIVLPSHDERPASSEERRADGVLGSQLLGEARAMLGAYVVERAAPSAMSSTGERLVSLRGASGPLGVLVVRGAQGDAANDGGDAGRLLDAFASPIASALERTRLAEDAQRAHLESQQEKIRNALLSSVSHDLRTPLAVVKGAVTALMHEGPRLPAARRQEYLETISDEANRLNRLVRNLLDMTSLEAGAIRVRKDWQPLEEVVGVVLNRLEDQLEDRRVEVEIPSDASMVPFDAVLIEHVLMNLVENAVKYTPRGSPITVRAREVPSGVEVEVADRGPGIPPGQEALVFEKFHRADAKVIGMGLGLTICRGMVAVHGGRIWCENRAGGGASFRFVLPREGDPPPMRVLPESGVES